MTPEQIDAAEDCEQLQRRFDTAMRTLSDALDGKAHDLTGARVDVRRAARQAVEWWEAMT